MITLIMIILFTGACWAAYQTMKDAHMDRMNRKVEQQCANCGKWYDYKDENCSNCGC